MAKNLYNLDVTKAGAVHYIVSAVLTDDQFVLIQRFLADVVANAIGGVTAASISAAAANPLDFNALQIGLKEHIPLGKHSTRISIPSERDRS